MNRLTLIYPKDFEEIVSEAIAIAHITGLATQTDSENNTIIVSPIPNGSTLKSIFTKELINNLEEQGVEIEVE